MGKDTENDGNDEKSTGTRREVGKGVAPAVRRTMGGALMVVGGTLMVMSASCQKNDERQVGGTLMVMSYQRDDR